MGLTFLVEKYNLGTGATGNELGAAFNYMTWDMKAGDINAKGKAVASKSRLTSLGYTPVQGTYLRTQSTQSGSLGHREENILIWKIVNLVLKDKDTYEMELKLWLAAMDEELSSLNYTSSIRADLMFNDLVGEPTDFLLNHYGWGGAYDTYATYDCRGKTIWENIKILADNNDKLVVLESGPSSVPYFYMYPRGLWGTSTLVVNVGQQIRTIKWDKDVTDVINKVTVVGKDSAGAAISVTVSDSTSITDNGMMEQKFYYPEVSTTADATAIANKILAKYKDAKDIAICEMQVCKSNLGYLMPHDMGYYNFNIVDTLNGKNMTLNLVSYQYDSRKLLYKCTFGTLRGYLAQTMADMNTRIKDVESGMNQQLLTTSSPNFANLVLSGTLTMGATPAIIVTTGRVLQNVTMDAGLITSGLLPLTRGGTGAGTQAGAANAVLPAQAGNSGKYLTTDGSNVSWATVSGGGGAHTLTDVNNTVSGRTAGEVVRMSGATTYSITKLAFSDMATGRVTAAQTLDGTSGYFLKANGAGVDPSYAQIAQANVSGLTVASTANFAGLLLSGVATPTLKINSTTNTSFDMGLGVQVATDGTNMCGLLDFGVNYSSIGTVNSALRGGVIRVDGRSTYKLFQFNYRPASGANSVIATLDYNGDLDLIGGSLYMANGTQIWSKDSLGNNVRLAIYNSSDALVYGWNNSAYASQPATSIIHWGYRMRGVSYQWNRLDSGDVLTALMTLANSGTLNVLLGNISVPAGGVTALNYAATNGGTQFTMRDALGTNNMTVFRTSGDLTNHDTHVFYDLPSGIGTASSRIVFGYSSNITQYIWGHDNAGANEYLMVLNAGAATTNLQVGSGSVAGDIYLSQHLYFTNAATAKIRVTTGPLSIRNNGDSAYASLYCDAITLATHINPASDVVTNIGDNTHRISNAYMNSIRNSTYVGFMDSAGAAQGLKAGYVHATSSYAEAFSTAGGIAAKNGFYCGTTPAQFINGSNLCVVSWVPNTNMTLTLGAWTTQWKYPIYGSIFEEDNFMGNTLNLNYWKKSSAGTAAIDIATGSTGKGGVLSVQNNLAAATDYSAIGYSDGSRVVIPYYTASNCCIEFRFQTPSAVTNCIIAMGLINVQPTLTNINATTNHAASVLMASGGVFTPRNTDGGPTSGTSLGTLVASTWYVVRIRCTSAGCYYSLNNGTEVAITANRPTLGLAPYFALLYSTATGTKTVLLDYIRVWQDT